MKKDMASRFPDATILMIGFIIIAAVMTYIIPAGEFARVADPTTGRMVVEAGSFKTIEQNPSSFMDLFMAIPNGMKKASTIIFFLLLIGGSFGIVNGTGSIEALMAKTVNKFKGGNSGKLIISGLIIAFGLAPGTIGMFGETLVFIPVVMVLMISLGYDALVATAIVMATICTGYAASPMNPFNVGVAQGIAGLPYLSGMWFRWIYWVVAMLILIAYVLKYANKIKTDPSKSLVKHIDYSDIKTPESDKIEDISTRQKAVLATFFGGIVGLVIIMINFQFYIPQVAAYFFFLGIAVGTVYGMRPNDMVGTFVNGAKDMVYASLLVGFASSISVILTDGKILDSIVYYVSLPLQDLPNYLAAGSMVFVQAIINFFVPSGSGQAMVTMPVMAPLSDVLGFSRQVAVLAFQIGDGFMNAIVPTLGLLMAGISIGRIPYLIWLKFMYKLIAIQLIVGFIFCIIAVLIGLT